MLGGRRRVPATLLGVAAAPSSPTRLSAWLLPAKSARPVPLGHAAPHASAEGRVTARPRPRTQVTAALGRSRPRGNARLGCGTPGSVRPPGLDFAAGNFQHVRPKKTPR